MKSKSNTVQQSYLKSVNVRLHWIIVTNILIYKMLSWVREGGLWVGVVGWDGLIGYKANMLNNFKMGNSYIKHIAS